MDRHQRLVLHLRPHGGLGEDGEPGADLDHPLDRLDVVELHDVADLDAVAAEEAIGLAAGGNVALVTDQVLPLELPDRDLTMARERMARRAGEHQPILAEGQHGDLRPSARIGDHAEVDLAPERLLVDLVRTAVLEVEMDLRVGLQVALDLRRELVEAD